MPLYRKTAPGVFTELCMFCNRPLQELPLFIHTTWWCPQCEGDGEKVDQTPVQRALPGLKGHPIDGWHYTGRIIRNGETEEETLERVDSFHDWALLPPWFSSWSQESMVVVGKDVHDLDFVLLFRGTGQEAIDESTS